MNRFASHPLLRAAVLPIALVAIWQVAGMMVGEDAKRMPTPAKVLKAAVDLVGSGELPAAIGQSLVRVFGGFVVASLIAIPLGLVMGSSRAVERNLDPLIESFRPVAAIAVLPLAILWMGTGTAAAVFIVSYAAFFPLVINTISGVKRVDRNLLQAAATMGVAKTTTLRTVVFPGALPSIGVGMRIALGVAWTAIIAAELAVGAKSGGGGSGGIGQMMFVFYAYSVELNRIVVCMIAVGVVAYFLDRGLRGLLAWGNAVGTLNGIAKLSMAGLGKSFRLPNGDMAAAVQDFSLDVREGEFMVLVGPSGCGKTTVLNMLAGLETPTSGTLALDGRAIVGPGADRGVMFQDYALFPWRTVRENVEFGLRFGPAGKGLSTAEREQRVSRYLDLVHLTQAQVKYPHQLSGGMRQRVALARLMANEPEILLMDEPLAALDAQTRLVLQDELLRIWGQDRPANERRTVVFITHAIDEAVFLADRVAVMTSHPGRLKTVIDVPLARPRNDGTRALPEFQALSQEIWNLIRAEAVRATMT